MNKRLDILSFVFPLFSSVTLADFALFSCSRLFIFQPHRTYYLEDPNKEAIEWVKKIEEVHTKYFGSREN